MFLVVNGKHQNAVLHIAEYVSNCFNGSAKPRKIRRSQHAPQPFHARQRTVSTHTAVKDVYEFGHVILADGKGTLISADRH